MNGLVILLLIVAILNFILLNFFSEDAPDWVEQDEYYRSRWYK